MWTTIKKNPIDTANYYHGLMKNKNIKRNQLATFLNVSYDKVKIHIALLKLEREIQSGIGLGLISINHGKQLLKFDNREAQIMLYLFTVKLNLTVRQLKKLIDEFKHAQKRKKDYSTYMFNGDLKYRKNNKIKIKNYIPWKSTNENNDL